MKLEFIEKKFVDTKFFQMDSFKNIGSLYLKIQPSYNKSLILNFVDKYLILRFINLLFLNFNIYYFQIFQHNGNKIIFTEQVFINISDIVFLSV